jgi:dienelactone hydrolase
MSTDQWRERFRQPFIYKFQVAQNHPERALSIENTSGKFELYATDQKYRAKRVIGSYPDGQLFGTISSDGKEIYAPKGDSNEYGHMYAYAFEGEDACDLTPDAPPYVSFEVVTARHSRAIAFFASMDNEVLIFFTKRAGNIPARIIFRGEGQAGFPACALSEDGEYCAVSYSQREAEKEVWKIRVIHTTNGTTVHEWNFSNGHSYALYLEVHDDACRVLVQTNIRGYEEAGWIDATRLQPEFLQEKASYDVFPLAYDPSSGSIVSCSVREGNHALSISAPGTFPGKPIGPTHGSYDTYYGGAQIIDASTILARWQSSVLPADIIRISLETGSYVPCGFVRASTKSVPFQGLTCKTPDGTLIQAWVARPSHTDGPVPFVIDLHGGPDAVTLDAFSAEAQTWIDWGIGYCGLNYRGSVSFGKEFQNSIIGHPGTLETEDCLAMKKELARRGWADPAYCILSGYSWGGFVTLLALGKSPTEWAAGVALVPVADWLQNYELMPAYLRNFDTNLFEGTPQEVPERYEIASPATYVEALDAPVLIIAAKEDVRCPIGQIESYTQKARAHHKDVTLEVYDMGHVSSFGNADLSIPIYERIHAFLTEKRIPLR